MIASSSEDSDTSRSWWLFLAYLALFTLTNAGYDSSEGSLSYRQAVIILTDFRLSIDGEPYNINYFPGPDGHQYSARELGGAILQFPVAATNVVIERLFSTRVPPETMVRLQNFLTSLQSGVFMAMGARFFFLILRERYGQSVRVAWLATLLLVTTTFYWSYSRSLFDGVIALPFLVGSFYYLLRFQSGDRPKDLILASALIGFGVTIRISVLFGVVGLFAFLLVSPPIRVRVLVTRVATAAVTLAPFGVWTLWYNHLRTGNAFVSPMQLYQGQNGLTGDLIEGLLGLTLSPGKGLLIYCPLLLFSALLFPRFVRRDPPTGVYLAVVGGLWFLVHGRLKVWYGSWGWGPRHFITILPLLMLPFAVELRVIARSRLLIGATAVLASWGLTLAVASIVINYHYRMALASQEQRLDDDTFIWSVGGSQSIDAISCCARNCRVMLGWVPPEVVVGASPINIYGSNTINVWSNTLIKTGFPFAVVIGTVALLILVCGYTGLRSYRAPSPTMTPSHPT
jgi:hypothetical protein